MTEAVIAVGEKVHIIQRRNFKEDIRRHFAGTVLAASDGMIRVQGYGFVLNPVTGAYMRRPELRTRPFGLLGSGYIVFVLPSNVTVDKIRYEMFNGRLVITDGSDFTLDLDEYNWST